MRSCAAAPGRGRASAASSSSMKCANFNAFKLRRYGTADICEQLACGAGYAEDVIALTTSPAMNP